jgi:repressor LexA
VTSAIRPLTARQSAIVDCIRTHVATHGYPPSIRDIGQAVGLASTGAVAYQLAQLAALGAIRRDPDRPRALVVLDPQACPTCGRGGAGPGQQPSVPLSAVAAEQLSGPVAYPCNPPAVPTPQNRSQAVPR